MCPASATEPFGDGVDFLIKRAFQRGPRRLDGLIAGSVYHFHDSLGLGQRDAAGHKRPLGELPRRRRVRPRHRAASRFCTTAVPP